MPAPYDKKVRANIPAHIKKILKEVGHRRRVKKSILIALGIGFVGVVDEVADATDQPLVSILKRVLFALQHPDDFERWYQEASAASEVRT